MKSKTTIEHWTDEEVSFQQFDIYQVSCEDFIVFIASYQCGFAVPDYKYVSILCALQ